MAEKMSYAEFTLGTFEQKITDLLKKQPPPTPQANGVQEALAILLPYLDE
ncbi:MAG: hypothetical protein Q9O24_01470 [Gammaproteobacteria bacterium]|nr:hypothetical protein [Gammaproteobacteria bacterium]